MKVELLINLKIRSGQVVEAGTIFSDELVPIPESIMRRVQRGTARIVHSPAPLKKEVVQEQVKESAKEKAPVPEKPKTKKPLLKKKGEDNG